MQFQLFSISSQCFVKRKAAFEWLHDCLDASAVPTESALFDPTGELYNGQEVRLKGKETGSPVDVMRLDIFTCRNTLTVKCVLWEMDTCILLSSSHL